MLLYPCIDRNIFQTENFRFEQKKGHNAQMQAHRHPNTAEEGRGRDSESYINHSNVFKTESFELYFSRDKNETNCGFHMGMNF